MAPIENSSHKPPVIIGYGTKPHEAALRTGGADRVLIHPDRLASLMDMAEVALRPEDTLLMVQPGLLSLKDMKALLKAAGGHLHFQVVGHQAFPLSTDRTIAAWRKLKPKSSDAEVISLRGRPSEVSYTVEQADAIIRLWHEKPRRMPKEITPIAEQILGINAGTLKDHWVRDLVIKYVGTGRRDKPDNWKGIIEKEND